LAEKGKGCNPKEEISKKEEPTKFVGKEPAPSGAESKTESVPPKEKRKDRRTLLGEKGQQKQKGRKDPEKPPPRKK